MYRLFRYGFRKIHLFIFSIVVTILSHNPDLEGDYALSSLTGKRLAKVFILRPGEGGIITIVIDITSI